MRTGAPIRNARTVARVRPGWTCRLGRRVGGRQHASGVGLVVHHYPARLRPLGPRQPQELVPARVDRRLRAQGASPPAQTGHPRLVERLYARRGRLGHVLAVAHLAVGDPVSRRQRRYLDRITQAADGGVTIQRRAGAAGNGWGRSHGTWFRRRGSARRTRRFGSLGCTGNSEKRGHGGQDEQAA